MWSEGTNLLTASPGIVPRIGVLRHASCSETSAVGKCGNCRHCAIPQLLTAPSQKTEYNFKDLDHLSDILVVEGSQPTGRHSYRRDPIELAARLFAHPSTQSTRSSSRGGPIVPSPGAVTDSPLVDIAWSPTNGWETCATNEYRREWWRTGRTRSHRSSVPRARM